MSENSAELLIELSLDGGDTAELDELTRQLRAEVAELNVRFHPTGFGGSRPKGDQGG